MTKKQLASHRREQIETLARFPGGPPETEVDRWMRKRYGWGDPTGPPPAEGDDLATNAPPADAADFNCPIYCTVAARDAWLDVLMGTDYAAWRSTNEIADRDALDALVPPALFEDDYATGMDAWLVEHRPRGRDAADFIARQARQAALEWEPGDPQP